MIEIIIGLIMAIFKPVEYKGIVDREYQKKIHSYLTDIKFDWHFMEDTTVEFTNTPQRSTPSFGNLIYYSQNKDNPHYDFFKPLITALEEAGNFKIVDLLRVRAGFLLNTKYSLPNMPYKYNTPHVDYDIDHYTAVYYVNEADGDTVVFHETAPAEKFYPLHKSTPEPGKLLLFNGRHYHSSTCPKVHTRRIAITINFTADING
jgi:hypothetical protein